MEKKSPSITAEDMAGHRAFEMLRPENERVCEDPFAQYFINEQTRKTLKSPFKRKIRNWIFQAVHPGGSDAVVIRARFIDDFVKKQVKEGLEQLVILGAGYDCRPYRMEELKNGISVFEVDHPATQEIKTEKLGSILKSIPNNVHFIPYSISEKGLEDTLLKSGYDVAKKSLFIMEGLVMYLPREDVAHILEFVANNAGNGSSVVFDYLPIGIDDGSIGIKVGKTLHNYAKKRGEPFQFGSDEKGIKNLLEQTGFQNIDCVTAENCRAKYFHGPNQKRKISQLFSFAHGEVKTG